MKITQTQGQIAVGALMLYDIYKATPQDRGGPAGPKGKALQAFVEAKAAALDGIIVSETHDIQRPAPRWPGHTPDLAPGRTLTMANGEVWFHADNGAKPMRIK